MHGLNTLSLDKLVLERGEALDSLREKAVIALGDIRVMGMYKYTAECTNWFCIVQSFDSEVNIQSFTSLSLGASVHSIEKHLLA